VEGNIYARAHVRLPQPIHDTIIVRPVGQPLGQPLGQATAVASGAEQGVPVDHPEVQTPSGVTGSVQKANQTIRMHGEIRLTWEHPLVSVGRDRVCRWITLTYKPPLPFLA